MIVACEPEEEKITNDPQALIALSDDTVMFDTLLTIRTSITRRFRIFNPNKKAIQIDEIKLGYGNRSQFSMIVNGEESNRVKDQIIFGGDSLLVLINVSIDPQDKNLPYIVKDSVIIEWGQYQTHVKLVAWGQDANFIYGDTLRNETWTAERPYIIYGYGLVDSLATLTVEPGTRIYIDNYSNLFVKGSLKILGDSGNHVLIRNTRFDEDYVDAPGQWGGIYFLEGSKDNEVRFADIENGTIGLRVGTPDDDNIPDVVVSNTIIRHMAQAGILAFSSDLDVTNTLIYNVGAYLVGNFIGGNYRYEHCTFSNYPTPFINDDPMIQFSDNIVISDTETLIGDLNFTMINCIAWVGTEEAMFMSDGGGAKVDTLIRNNIIKSKTGWPGNFNSTIRSFPGFEDALVYNYALDSLSNARDKAIPGSVITDITGKLRDELPDIGAYERFDRK